MKPTALAMQGFAVLVAAALILGLAAPAAQALDEDIRLLRKQVHDLREQNRTDEAEQVAKQLVAVSRERSGEVSLDHAVALEWLSSVYWQNERFGDAVGLDKQALAIREQVQGESAPETIEAMTNLAAAVGGMRDLNQSIALYRRALALEERVYGVDDVRLAKTLTNLATALADDPEHPEGYDESTAIFQRVLDIQSKAPRPDERELLKTLDELAGVHARNSHEDEALRILQDIRVVAKAKNLPLYEAKAMMDIAQLISFRGQDAEALELFEQAVAIQEKYSRTRGKNETLGALAYAESLSNLGSKYFDAGRYKEAAQIQERALALKSQGHDDDSVHIAHPMHNLASAYQALGRLEAARKLFEQAVAIHEKTYGPMHGEVGQSLYMLASVQRDLGDLGMAAATAARVTAIYTKSHGAGHVNTGQAIGLQGSVARAAGWFEEARTFYRAALAILEKGLGPNAPMAASTRAELARAECSLGEFDAALADARQAVTPFAARLSKGVRSSLGEGVYYGADAFPGLICAAYGAAGQRSVGEREAIASEALIAAAYEDRSVAASAVSQMALRAGAADPALAAAARRQQDLASKWEGIDKRLSEALSVSTVGAAGAKVERLRAQRTEAEKQLAAATSELERTYPDFAALTNPKPLTIKEAQALLRGDEALVAFFVGRDESYVWAITATGWDWQKLAIGSKALAAKVAAFRKPLDLWAKIPRGLARLTADSSACAPEADPRGLVRVDASAGAACGDGAEFSLARAHELYATLLGPVEKRLAGKAQVMIVPAGPLSGLPFNALVTDAPAGAGTTVAAFRQAPWMIRRHAVTVLPAVASLRALRALGKPSQAARPFIGFGDPDFSGKGGKTRKGRKDTAATQVADAAPLRAAELQTRGVSDFFRGGLADGDALRRGLPALPDTADELRTIATTLSASEADVVLGAKASERTIKGLSASGQLAGYRIVAFATHGLVAGELQGLAEPAIALTVPAKASEDDDGLLTASEAANLKLDADWVILSACNTAAGGASDAEALSGLSRAFFYAGSRALLVSHWQVDSAAAVKLTTATFSTLNAEPALGRSGAFRQSMLKLIDKGEAYEAHPAYWAPFFVVGEGGGVN